MKGKKYFALTPAELLEHSVWVLAMDVATFSQVDENEFDDDTGLVVPLPSDQALVQQLFDNCICYARASFVAANGRTFVGLMKCWGGEGVAETQPEIATDDGHISFYWGIAVPDESRLEPYYRLLGATPEEIFPMRYRLDVSIPDAPAGGVLEGFYYLNSDRGESEVKCVR